MPWRHYFRHYTQMVYLQRRNWWGRRQKIVRLFIFFASNMIYLTIECSCLLSFNGQKFWGTLTGRTTKLKKLHNPPRRNHNAENTQIVKSKTLFLAIFRKIFLKIKKIIKNIVMYTITYRIDSWWSEKSRRVFHREKNQKQLFSIHD